MSRRRKNRFVEERHLLTILNWYELHLLQITQSVRGIPWLRGPDGRWGELAADVDYFYDYFYAVFNDPDHPDRDEWEGWTMAVIHG